MTISDVKLETPVNSDPPTIMNLGVRLFLASLAIFTFLLAFYFTEQFDLIKTLGFDVPGYFKSSAEFVQFSFIVRVSFSIVIAFATTILATSIRYILSARTRLGTSLVPITNEPSIIRPIKDENNIDRDIEKINLNIFPDNSGWVIDRLGERILNLQLHATMIYWTIILNLLFGVFMIIFSGYLVSLDSTLTNTWARVDAQLSDANDNLSRASRNAFDLGSRYSASDQEDTRIQAEAKRLVEAVADAQARVKQVSARYDLVFNAVLNERKDRLENGHDINWSSTILRVGILSVLIFLTQILVALFRYNSRLIAFYTSRRNAIALATANPDKLKDFAELLFPSNLDFGKEPRHPYEAIGTLFRRVRDRGALKQRPSGGSAMKPGRAGKRDAPVQRRGANKAPDADSQSEHKSGQS